MAEIAAGLKQQLEEIYAPLQGLSAFEAESDGNWKKRTILIIRDRAVENALQQILKKLEETKVEGQKLSDMVWKGITYKDQQYKLWVQQLQDFEKGETGSFCIEDFNLFKYDQPQHEIGVNIVVQMQ